MLTTSLSHALWEIPTSAVAWPATTKPWLVGTLLMNAGGPDCHLQTFKAHTGSEFAAHLQASGGQAVHILCAIPHSDGWDIRDVVSVKIGRIGGTAVVVVQDAEGLEFCPDAPALSPSSISQLVLVGVLIDRPHSKPAAQSASLALTVHHLAAQRVAAAASSGQASAPAAQAAV